MLGHVLHLQLLHGEKPELMFGGVVLEWTSMSLRLVGLRKAAIGGSGMAFGSGSHHSYAASLWSSYRTEIRLFLQHLFTKKCQFRKKKVMLRTLVAGLFVYRNG